MWNRNYKLQVFPFEAVHFSVFLYITYMLSWNGSSKIFHSSVLEGAESVKIWSLDCP